MREALLLLPVTRLLRYVVDSGSWIASIIATRAAITGLAAADALGHRVVTASIPPTDKMYGAGASPIRKPNWQRDKPANVRNKNERRCANGSSGIQIARSTGNTRTNEWQAMEAKMQPSAPVA